MKTAIFIADSNGRYPVPAVHGGAVSTLIESLLYGNNKEKYMDLTVVTYYEKNAEIIAKEKYPNVNFKWIRIPYIIMALDMLFFKVITTFFKSKKGISYKSVFSLVYYIVISTVFLSTHTFDKVVLENNIPLAWIIRLSKYKGKYYYHFHNVPRIDAKCREVFSKCSGYLCVSKYVATQITSSNSAIGKISEKKVRVLYNCIDVELFSVFKDRITIRREICERYNINPKNKILVFVGRLSSEKGIDKILRAMKSLKNENLTLLIIGSLMHNADVTDSYQNELKQLSKKLGDKVVFTGYISQEELPKFYNIADEVVLPSMWDEPAGLTMVEALSCGAFVVTTLSGGIPEYVGNYATLLERDSIIQNLTNTLDENTNSKDISAQRNYIVQNFSRNDYIGKFYRILKDW